MDITLEPGVYVVAVSGGVDSMALLDMLRSMPKLRLIVAHYDHGIRTNSNIDRKLVQAYANRHGLTYVYDEGNLGSGASEAAARQARYDFLRKVKDTVRARAIITAHHHDDVLETAVINLLRGTNRRGLTSLKSRGDIVRPLLQVPKSALKTYAKDNQLVWREDSTNQDTKYLRNHVRHNILNKLSVDDRNAFAALIVKFAELNQEIDSLLVNHLHLQPSAARLDRKEFTQLPHAVAREVLAAWLGYRQITGYNRKTLERLVVMAKISVPGKQIDIVNGNSLQVTANYLALVSTDR